MSASMPWSLLIAWILFSLFASTHQRHAENFQGRSKAYHIALKISVILGWLVGLGLFIYYCIYVAWYWPVVLILVILPIAGIPSAILVRYIGGLEMSLVSFAGWPVSAIWVFFIIRGLHP
jgi:hypothetical protein